MKNPPILPNYLTLIFESLIFIYAVIAGVFDFQDTAKVQSCIDKQKLTVIPPILYFFFLVTYKSGRTMGGQPILQLRIYPRNIFKKYEVYFAKQQGNEQKRPMMVFCTTI